MENLVDITENEEIVEEVEETTEEIVEEVVTEESGEGKIEISDIAEETLPEKISEEKKKKLKLLK